MTPNTVAASDGKKGITNLSFLAALAPYAHWTLRLAVGSVFLYHGLTKFPVLNEMSAMMGMPVAMIALLAVMETAGGALALIGGFTSSWITRLSSVLLIPVMIGAIAMVHWPQWSFVASETHPMGGMEFQVMMILVLTYLFIKGKDNA
jgi:putative oxidoreductase